MIKKALTMNRLASRRRGHAPRRVIKTGSHMLVASLVLLVGFVFNSCDDFLNPDQGLHITEEQLYSDYNEYRSAAIGLYGLQQNLVEQLVILGELRGDLMATTANSDADLVEIYNFDVSKKNKYASPLNFFKLISASNRFIASMKKYHPEVLDPASAVTNYDRMYAEALCMRAWAYFNAVRIYGKVPFIHESLTSVDEIEKYLNSPATYVDSTNIVFSTGGYFNDTLKVEPIQLTKQFYTLDMVIDVFTNQLEKEIKNANVGVNHYIDNGDITWEVTIWNQFAYRALLGQMYLTQGNLAKAVSHLEKIIYATSDNTNRYQLTTAFGSNNWQNIFKTIDRNEHIFTLWFDKANQQQNDFQKLFWPSPHKYMLKPTQACVHKWETIWQYTVYDQTLQPNKTSIVVPKGIDYSMMVGDYYRGYGISYVYLKENTVIDGYDYMRMISAKYNRDYRTVNTIMENVDTILYKFSIGKNTYDQDVNFCIYRAAGIHLYLAEIYAYYEFLQDGKVNLFFNNGLSILNDGSNYNTASSRPQKGVRGRVGFGSTYNKVTVGNIIFEHDPFTNQITGYKDLTGNLLGKQRYFEEQVLDERARELAFEGERFYDLMRVAKRRNDPSFLAKIVSEKYPVGKREEIYNKLLDENNWYIQYFD